MTPPNITDRPPGSRELGVRAVVHPHRGDLQPQLVEITLAHIAQGVQEHLLGGCAEHRGCCPQCAGRRVPGATGLWGLGLYALGVRTLRFRVQDFRL